MSGCQVCRLKNPPTRSQTCCAEAPNSAVRTMCHAFSSLMIDARGIGSTVQNSRPFCLESRSSSAVWRTFRVQTWSRTHRSVSSGRLHSTFLEADLTSVNKPGRTFAGLRRPVFSVRCRGLQDEIRRSRIGECEQGALQANQLSGSAVVAVGHEISIDIETKADDVGRVRGIVVDQNLTGADAHGRYQSIE